MRKRGFAPIVAVAAIPLLSASFCGTPDPTGPGAPAASRMFRWGGDVAITSVPTIAVWAMTVNPTSTSYTLTRNTAVKVSGYPAAGSGSISPTGTISAGLRDSVAALAATNSLSDMFANKAASFGCSGSVSVSQDTKIAVFDRLTLLTATDSTHYLAFDRVAPNGSTPVHHLLFYALGAGRATGTTSCSFSGAGGSGTVVTTTTTDITIKPGWNVYSDSAASSSSSFQTISSNDTTYTGPYVMH